MREKVKDRDSRIDELKIEVMASKGLLHCRGLLEQCLKEVHLEKKLGSNFNATDVCANIAIGSQQGKYETVLVKAAKRYEQI